MTVSAPALKNNFGTGSYNQNTLPTSVGGVSVSAPTSTSGTSVGGVSVSAPTSTPGKPLEGFKNRITCPEADS